MATIDLRQTIRDAIVRSTNIHKNLFDEMRNVNWDAAERLFNTMQAKSNGPMEDDLCQRLRKHKEFQFHANVRSALLHLDEKHCQGEEELELYEDLFSILDQFEGYEMKIPKWIPECDIELVRALVTNSNIYQRGYDRCNTCSAPALDVTRPDFEADVLKLASFTDFDSYKKRRKCACCAAAGDSVMETHNPKILVCGTCGIPVTCPDKSDEAGVFMDALVAKLWPRAV